MRALLLEHWRLFLLWVLLWSGMEFFLMGEDKRRARRGAWRVRERTFFLLALLGGSPGALAGMYLFRHKTKHWYFRFGLPLIALVQAGLAAWLLAGQ